MFGRKNKGKDKDSGRDRGKGGGSGGNMAAMLGLGGLDEFDVDDAALEAELLELEGKPHGGGKKRSKEGGKKKMTMEEIQKLAADSTRDIDLDADVDDDDWDEEDLLAELEGAEEETENESHMSQAPNPPVAQPRQQPVVQPKPPVAQPRQQPVVQPKPHVAQPRQQPVVQPKPHVAQPHQQPVVQPKPPVAQFSQQPVVQPKPPVVQSQQPVAPSRAPPPTVPKPNPAASPPSSTAPPLTEKDTIRAVLKERYAQYLEVSKKAKAAGNEAAYKKNGVMAAKFLKVIKGFDDGAPVDLSQMPPPPPGYMSSHRLDATMIQNFTASSQQQESQSESHSQTSGPEKSVSGPSPSEEDSESSVDPTIPIPKSPQEALEQRLSKYKSGVESAQKEGNSGKARRMGRIVKQYEDALKALKAGKTVDFSELPAPPGYPPIPVGGAASKPHPLPVPVQESAAAMVAAKPKEPVAVATAQGHSNSGPAEEEAEVDPSVPQPKTPLEALHQRLDKYRAGVESAKAEDNGSKARRMGRIVKQYEDAIKTVKAGKSVDFSELPTPPGFPPIPVGGAAHPAKTAPSGVLPPPKVTRNAQQQLALLQQRCSEYTSAAIRHRDAGERDEALRLLKYVKDLQAYIDLSKQGMPVDETAIPPPLHEGAGGGSAPQRLPVPSKPVKASDGDDDTFELIEDQIQKQIDFCEENANVYEKSGNRPGASRFRNMAEDCKQELLAIKGIHGQGLAPPRFTVEMRTVNLLHGFPDLGSSECEVKVIRLADAPKDHTIYVEVEFPYPSDDAQKDQTQKTKEEVNPQLNSSHKFSIDRKHKRAMVRALTRGVKLTLWQHKAMWKDTALGTATLKCEDLETKAEVRGIVNFYDGRKEMTHKVEVAVRLREPLNGPDVEEKQIKWLVFSDQIVKKSSVAMPKAQAPKDRSAASGGPSQTALAGPVKLEETFSIATLRLEHQLAQGNPELQDQIKKKLQAVQQKLQTDRTFAPNYKKAVEASVAKETKLYQQYSKAGRQKEAKVLMERVKTMQAELKKL